MANVSKIKKNLLAMVSTAKSETTLLFSMCLMDMKQNVKYNIAELHSFILHSSTTEESYSLIESECFEWVAVGPDAR